MWATEIPVILDIQQKGRDPFEIKLKVRVSLL